MDGHSVQGVVATPYDASDKEANEAAEILMQISRSGPDVEHNVSEGPVTGVMPIAGTGSQHVLTRATQQTAQTNGTNTAMPHNAHGSWSASATAIGSSNVAVPVQAKGQVTRPAQVAGSDEVTDPDHITDPDQVMDSVEVANPVQSPGFAAPVQSPGSATPVQSSSSGTPGQLIRPQLPVWDCIQLVLRGNGWRRAGEIHESIGQLCDSRGWDNYAPQTVRKTLMCKKRDSNKLMVKNGHPPTYQLV